MDWTDEPALVAEDGDEMVTLKGTMTLGRQAANDLVIAEAEVSRKHAEIAETDGGYRIRDLGSTNGTFVNEQKVGDEGSVLRDGDRVRLGASKKTFVYRHSTADTLQLTLIQPALEKPGGQETAIGEAVEAPASPEASGAVPAGSEMAASVPKEEEMYEGTVRLKVQAQGGMGVVVSFVQALRDKPELRLQRLTNSRGGTVNVWIGLREPVRLRSMLSEMEAVAEVGLPMGRDLSPESEDPPLTVRLKAEDLTERPS